jgi:hypothetical protein
LAQGQWKSLWADHQLLVDLILHIAVADPLGKESTYLYCLCIQEKAERFQTRLERILSSPRRDKAADKALAKAKSDARNWWENAWRKWANLYDADYALSEEMLRNRLGELQHYALQSGRDQAAAEIATALYESLVLDMSRTAAARLLQARALEKAGRREQAVDLLEKQLRDLNEWESNGHLEALEKFGRQHQPFVRGTPFSRTESLTWLGVTVAYQLKRLNQKK